MNCRVAFCLLAACLASGIASATTTSAVEATLRDGRQIVGQVDEATDESLLWMRQTEGRVSLATSYRWQEVATLTSDGKPLTRELLLASLGEYAVSGPSLFASDEGTIANRPVMLRSTSVRRATGCNFVADLANWDGDAQLDGYVVAVTVFDQWGEPMPVRGSLSVRLVGERTGRRGEALPAVELERWSDRLEPTQFAGGPAVFRLPFRQTRPEAELDIAPGAILQVQVGAFGHGSFAASSAVPTRQFNPVRDRLQQQTGQRWLPGEVSQ